MSTPFEGMAEIDRLLHDPSRMAITSALSACQSADFLYLQRITGLSKGNLSAHLTRLENGDVVEIEKSRGTRPRTTISLTGSGRTAVDEHWARLLRLRSEASGWTDPVPDG